MDKSAGKSSLWQRIRHRPVESYNKVWLGAIGLLMIGILIATILTAKMIGLGYTRYTAELLQAASLRPGDNVSLAGVSVGNVTSTRLAGDHVEVGFRIRDDIRLRRETKAAVKLMTILGGQYLELRPAGDGPLPNRTIDLAHTEVPYDLQALLSDATSTFEQVDADQIAASTAVLARQLQGLPAVIPRAMENIRTLSSVIARRRDQLGTLLASTATVAGTLHRQQSDIGSLITQGQDLLGEFVARRESFHSLMQAVTKLVDLLNRIVVKDRGAVNALVADTKRFTDLLGQHDDLFRSLLQVVPVAARNFTNSVGSGNSIDVNLSAGLFLDSWMCAISGRAQQFNMIPYFKDCK